jgi:hypothetical protein
VSTYVREKVLRIPRHKLNFAHIVRKLEEKFPNEDVMDDLGFYIESALPDLFDYGQIGKFQLSPTDEPFIDYVLDYEYDADGEFGKTRALTENEKKKYLPVFEKIDPEINMDFVRLVEFCWYNGCEAPDYYDHTNDPFYEEV